MTTSRFDLTDLRLSLMVVDSARAPDPGPGGADAGRVARASLPISHAPHVADALVHLHGDMGCCRPVNSKWRNPRRRSARRRAHSLQHDRDRKGSNLSIEAGRSLAISDRRRIDGVVTGSTGVLVMPVGPYLQALGLEKDDLVQALGLSFTASIIALAAGLASRAAYHVTAVSISAFCLVPALAGMSLGKWIRGRIDPETFRLLFLVGLLFLGSGLILRSAIQ